MYDTFNPLGLQHGVYILPMNKIFCNFEKTPANKVCLTFSSQNLTPV